MATPDARSRILSAAEKLIAERGMDVPLRDIAMAAEQRNNSAVQYHFGSRDGLIAAVVESRMPALERRRLELLAEYEAAGQPDDVRALVDTLFTPMAELSLRGEATHYARFLEAVRTHPAVAGRERLETFDMPAVRIIMTRLQRRLDEYPERLVTRRLMAMATTMFALLADLERDVRARRVKARDLSAMEEETVDMLVGLLTAPVAGRVNA